MKVELIGKTKQKGVGTLEILIAFALLMSALTFCTLLWSNDQSIVVDIQNSNSAKQYANNALAEMKLFSEDNFESITGTTTTLKEGMLSFDKKISLKDVSTCSKKIASKASWKTDLRDQFVYLETIITNTEKSKALGFDCPGKAPPGKWQNPSLFATDSSHVENLTSIDALNGFVYVGTTIPPYLLIAQTTSMTEGQAAGLFLMPNNGFTLESRIQDLDVVVWKNPTNNERKKYVFAAMASSTKQLAIIDVTDELSPVVSARRQLVNINPGGSQPYGYRVYYQDEKLYILTRETAGPEFHVFNVSNPSNPIELGPGTKLVGPTPPNGTTVNDFLVQDEIAYMAAEKNASELLVYNVSNPTSPIFMSNATVNLPGNQNGSSLFTLGNLLFFGRENNTSGPELYIFDISNPNEAISGLPIIGSVEIGADVEKIFVIDGLAFLSVNKSKNELQIWDVSDPSDLKNKSKKEVGAISHGGLDLDDSFLYLVGESGNGFMIYHDAP